MCEQLLSNGRYECFLAFYMIAATSCVCQYIYVYQQCLPFKVSAKYSYQVIHNITDSGCDLNLEEGFDAS